QGLPNYRLARYADDWCLLVSGTREHAEALREEIAGILAGMGLRLSPEKTLITHIDKGVDFLGWRIQRHRKRGTGRHYVYVYPAKKALTAIMAKIKAACRQNTNHPLAVLLHQQQPSPGACGEPGALSGARRVREAARRNPPVVTLTGRSGPTSLCSSGGERPSPLSCRSRMVKLGAA